jgi:hypothetical protein
VSRSGLYEDDGGDPLGFGRFRGRVASAMRGKRGQAALRELLAALDAMPNKRLIRENLVADGEYCTLGVLGAARGLPMDDLDPEDYDRVAEAFGIAPVMVQEIEFMNDEGPSRTTPEERWRDMRQWVASKIAKEPTP